MYTLCSNFVKYLKKQSDPDDVAYVMIGLNNAGKTTIASALQGELVENTRPTIGFKRKTYQADGFNLTVFDLGGKMQRIWKEYVAEVHGAIFVIDAADSDRLDEAKAALKTITEDPRFKGKPVIIYANKQDLPAALKADELAERLGLDAPDMQVTRYNIVACTALALDGAPDSVDPRLWEGMQWLNESSRKTWKAMSERVKEQMKEQDEERKVAALKRKADAAASRAARQLEREEEARQAAAKAADAERASLMGGAAGGTMTSGADSHEMGAMSTPERPSATTAENANALAVDVPPSPASVHDTLPSSPTNGDFHLPGTLTKSPTRPKPDVCRKIELTEPAEGGAVDPSLLRTSAELSPLNLKHPPGAALRV